MQDGAPASGPQGRPRAKPRLRPAAPEARAAESKHTPQSPAHQDIDQGRQRARRQRVSRQDDGQPDSAAGIVHRAVEHVPLAEAGTHRGGQDGGQDSPFHTLDYA